MIVYLVRHAKAFERDPAAWPDDRKRPLTADGRESFIRLAKRMRRVAPSVDLVESSRFVRAWQTAQLLHQEAGWPRPTPYEALERLDAGDPAAMRRALGHMRGIDRVAWVGHEPLLSQLASYLLTGEATRMCIAFKKGAIVAIDLPDQPAHDRRAHGSLRWMLTPGVASRLRRRA